MILNTELVYIGILIIYLIVKSFVKKTRPFTKEEEQRWNRRLEYNMYHAGDGASGIYFFPMVVHRGPHDIYIKKDPVLKRDVYLIAKNGPVQNWFY